MCKIVSWKMRRKTWKKILKVIIIAILQVRNSAMMVIHNGALEILYSQKQCRNLEDDLYFRLKANIGKLNTKNILIICYIVHLYKGSEKIWLYEKPAQWVLLDFTGFYWFFGRFFGYFNLNVIKIC